MEKKRQLTEKEKQKVLERHGRKCFVDGAPIAENEPIEFHHIKAFSRNGETDIENSAPVCRTHHRTIGTMSLQEYRDKIELNHFFGDESRYLDDLIRHKVRRCGEPIKSEIEKNFISLFYRNGRHDFPLYECPTTKWKYFYGTLPIEHIGNDKDLQPRPLREVSLWKLYRHFQINTQIAPSICRIDEKNNIILFDGQHKAAAQIWAGRTMIECKVYLQPDSRELKETNLEAHGPFRQMSFYSQELMNKYADIFGDDWKEFLNTEGEKSELLFFNFLINTKKKSKMQAKNEISLALQKEIIDDPNNKLARYRIEKSRGKKQPLSYARIKKTFFQHMLFPVPVNDEFETDTDFRKDEKLNLVRLMNIIAEEGLEGVWAPERADGKHKKAERIFSAGAIRAWIILLKDAINTHLNHYTDEERQRFFYCHIPKKEFDYFRNFVKKLFAHKLWHDPDPMGEIAARLSKDDAITAKNLFDEHNLTVKYILRLK